MNILSFDLTVVGGGVAGIAAAIAAARNGLKVALINDRSVPGGNGSSEIGVPISGACHQNHNAAIYAKEGGIVEEIRMRKQRLMAEGGWGMDACWDAVYFDMLYAEKNLSLFLNTLATGVETKGDRITGVYARHLTSEEEYLFQSDLFVDATGNGAIAAFAGAEYRHGREAKSEFGEYWAPDVADRKTMGNTFIFKVRRADHPVKFTAPSYAYDITKMEFFKWIDIKENFRRIGPHGFDWTFEFGGQLDIIKDAEDIDKELRCLTMGIWDYVKNSGRYPDAENMVLVRINCKSGSRESRRVIGDYILTENDIEQKKDYPDAALIGGWPMDVHAPLGIYDPAPASNFIPVTGIYNIPLRCLYSKNVPNLLLAGRDASFSHIALGSTRVIATCTCMGQAVGTAAVLCKKYGKLPRAIAAEHMDELRDMLFWDDQSILHRPDSTLIGWSASADSELAYENTEADGELPLERDLGLSLMLTEDRIDSLRLKARVVKDTVLKYKVLHGEHPETYLPSSLVTQGELSLSLLDGWFTLELNVPRGKDGKVYLVFEANPYVTFYTATYQPIGAVTHRYHTPKSHDCMDHDSIPLPHGNVGGYIAIDRTYEEHKNILFTDIIPTQHPYSAQSAVNGYSRPYFTPNLWQPTRLGDSLTLTAEIPCAVDEISIIFNTDLSTDSFGNKLPDCIAETYVLSVTDKDGKTELVRIEDNFLRRRVHKVGKRDVAEIKITLEKSTGKALPGIYAVKIR